MTLACININRTHGVISQQVDTYVTAGELEIVQYFGHFHESLPTSLQARSPLDH